MDSHFSKCEVNSFCLFSGPQSTPILCLVIPLTSLLLLLLFYPLTLPFILPFLQIRRKSAGKTTKAGRKNRRAKGGTKTRSRRNRSSRTRRTKRNRSRSETRWSDLRVCCVCVCCVGDDRGGPDCQAVCDGGGDQAGG